MSSFGDRFKKLRLDKGLTQDKLAEEFNKLYGYSFSKSTISQYEKNKRTPEMTALKRFVDYFNTSIDYLLCNDGYCIREKLNIYNNTMINTTTISDKEVKVAELDEILNMINTMLLKNEIAIDKNLLTKEEKQLVNDGFEITLNLIKKRRT